MLLKSFFSLFKNDASGSAVTSIGTVEFAIGMHELRIILTILHHSNLV
jgi:hypothetical protein